MPRAKKATETTTTLKNTSPKKRTPVRSPKKKAAASRLTPEERQRLIAEAAYLRAEKRGFEGGDPAQDWLEAEAEIEQEYARVS